MSLKKYQNELILLFAFLLMVGAFFYKNNQVSFGVEKTATLEQSASEFKELVALKKIWADKKISKRIDKLKKLVPVSKVAWHKKGKKMAATYTGLISTELNKLISKILNLPVQIQLLKIQKNGTSYNVEFKCKW
ncbi:MAG: hypothetical protein P794_04120 [Epsilonproteobacteria bacterium (ex Lamellibrachia satsuma)]|nr:MAG: hypothetical protein P794_04120 [Epsilonproteobacteria bacterium (ex Lamellibrachia satsuma)]